VLLTLSLIPAYSATPPKAGAVCSKSGTAKIYQGKTFTCIKSGKKLTWSKGIAISKPTPTSSSTTSPSPAPSSTASEAFSDLYSAPSENSDNVELCKIKETNLFGPRLAKAWDSPDAPFFSLTSGFPVAKISTQRNGTVKWALIPIDFPDLKGESNFRTRVDGQMIMLTDWFKTVSEGKLIINWAVAKKWSTLPSKTSDYTIGQSVNLGNAQNGAKLFEDAMKAADSDFDFTNIQNVVFILPKGQTFLNETSQGFPWDKAVINLVTNEGPISAFSMAGVFMDQPNKDYWGYWAHEFGHAISLPHIGRSRPPAALFAGYDLMASQDGPTRDLSGWLRFVAQWLPDDKVYCKEVSSFKQFEVTLVPLNSDEKGLKLAVIPVSATKAIVIESRRETKFSCQMSPKQNGALAYIYDANLSHGEDFLVPIAPLGRPVVSSPCPASPLIDSLLRTGDKVSFEGITIENLRSGNFDKIRITKD
jgi:M6 family metalloprotease-like protein